MLTVPDARAPFAHYDKVDIHSRAPVDRVAARVVFHAGGKYESSKRYVGLPESFVPFPMKPVPKNAPALVGRRFGRLTVKGLSLCGSGRWVCRCLCGTYVMRKAKAITNPENWGDRCSECQHLAYLKREELWRRTGRDVDIREL